MSEKVPHEVVTAFAELFVGCRKPYGEETGDGWQTRHSELSDELIAAHLDGVRTFGVRPGQQRAHFIALEVDLGGRNADLLAVRDAIMGEEGFRCWKAIRTASEELGIPPIHWVCSYSGNRSLHFWLVPEKALPFGAAHRIARALKVLTDRQGIQVCTAYPTNGSGGGQVLRLPWGRHRRTHAHAHFVDLGLFELTPRPYCPQDADYLSRIADGRVPKDVLEEAAQNAQNAQVLRPARPEPEGAQQAGLRKSPAPKEDRDPFLVVTVGRPCIAEVIAKGVPGGHRHSIAHLVRTELKACGLTLEQAKPIYLRYAQACDPPWPEAEALYDLETNWAVTDIAQRHSCKSAAPSTIFLRKAYCKGSMNCVALRKEGFEQRWGGEGLSANARVLYAALCKLEGQYLLRPGDRIRTTVRQLTDVAELTERTFKAARKELKARGLIAWKATSQGRGQGTFSVYWRFYPVPTPTRQSVQEQCTAAEDTAEGR